MLKAWHSCSMFIANSVDHNACANHLLAEPLENRLAAYVATHRVGQETSVVRGVMQGVYIRVAGLLVPAENNPRAQQHIGDSQAALLVASKCTLRLILIIIDLEALLCSQRQKPQHMAARQRRNKGFLGINSVRIGHRQRHHRRRRRGGYFQTAVELPAMCAAVAVIKEGLIAP